MVQVSGNACDRLVLALLSRGPNHTKGGTLSTNN